jgi:hypothetical protein
MKTFEFDIIKKNRKYFAASRVTRFSDSDTQRYKCKILIDSSSENLTCGTHDLTVDDISIRTKYGTDLIYRLSREFEVQSGSDVYAIKTDYNADFCDSAKKLGARWDSDDKSWVFPGFVSDEAEELDAIYNSERVAVEILINEDLYEQGVNKIMGIPISKSSGRDSGAIICEGVALIAGCMTSGGSIRNWYNVIREKTVIRLEMPVELVRLHQESGCEKFTINIIDSGK